jgi:hypothetical protein
MVAKSIDRVRAHTAPEINERINRQTDQTIAYFTQHPGQIPQRLRELDEEWDIERALETAASGITLFGIALSFLRGRKWLLLPIAVQSFFMQHALQGWCPPLPVLRRMGFRTEHEIERERSALLALQEGNGNKSRSRSKAKA